MNAETLVVVWILAWALGGGLVIFAVDAVLNRARRNRLIAAGIYPKPGTETDDDVRRLQEAGRPDLAVTCYRAVHRVGEREARAALLGETTLPPSRYPVAQVTLMLLGVGLGTALKHAGIGLVIGLAVGFAVVAFAGGRPPDQS